jgi:predicted nucleic acid-binding protein
MSADRAFVDTSILIYAIDKANPEKQAIAKRVLLETPFVVSAQVLSEFFWTATREVERKLSAKEALESIDNICSAMADPAVELDEPMIRSAVKLSSRYQLSYWDALLLAAAIRSGAKRLITEDLNDGALYDGVLIDNPFSSSVD